MKRKGASERSEGGGKARTLLIRNAAVIGTMDDERTVHRNGSVLIEGNRVKEIGAFAPPDRVDRVIEAGGMAVVPGMINTHHHLYQVLTRNIPLVQDAKLFRWLEVLYELWNELTAEGVYWSTLAGLGELLLSGCTTSSDHLYLVPGSAGNNLFDREIEAAGALGSRFHPTRGSMSRGRSKGGLPPDHVVQDEDAILEDSIRIIEKYHDPEPFSMCRVVLAPCSPFSVTSTLMEKVVDLARSMKVMCHTHLAETRDEEDYCLQNHGVRPLKYMESLGWVGRDVWFAHGIHFDDEELELLARTGTGVAHCPSSNLRLGSGIARVRRMLDLDIPVGLGVDGSASNDTSDMLAEARQCLLIHRYFSGVDSMSAEDVFSIATRGGARLLGRDDIGSLEEGKAADLAIFDLRQLSYAGALHDPLAALLFCGMSHRAHTVIVNGEIVVSNGKLVAVDEAEVVDSVNRISREMVERATARTGIDFHARR